MYHVCVSVIDLMKTEKLLHSYGEGGFKRILFTDEKVFSIEQKFTWQNDRIYARSSITAKTKATPILRRPSTRLFNGLV